MHEYFWQPIGKLKEKLIENYVFCKMQLYVNQFSNKKGAIGKPARPKKPPAHPHTHLSTKYPPRAYCRVLNICRTNFWPSAFIKQSREREWCEKNASIYVQNVDVLESANYNKTCKWWKQK